MPDNVSRRNLLDAAKALGVLDTVRVGDHVAPKARRVLTEADVVFHVEAEPEYVPIEGNAMASGDDAADRECYDWIESELSLGNQWAWCSVKVTATWEGFEGCDHLGCCSYESEAQFREPGGYFDDMKAAALADLNTIVNEAARKLASEGFA